METINTVGIGARIGCFLIGWNPILLKQCGEASRRTLRRYISAIIILSVIWGAIGFVLPNDIWVFLLYGSS